MTPDVSTRYEQIRSTGLKVCEALVMELEKLELEKKVNRPELERASYELSRDPALGDYSLVGVWRNAKGHKQGEILFHADGSFYAEYDVICTHPADPRWFVEAVSAWGKGDDIKSEVRLLPVAS